MTPQKVRQLVLAAYFVPILCIIGQVYLTSRIPLSRYTLHRITCDHLSLLNLWCGDGFQSHVANVYGMCLVFFLFFLPLPLILLSYIKIMVFILKTSGKARQKTLQTCSPHITYCSYQLPCLRHFQMKPKGQCLSELSPISFLVIYTHKKVACILRM